MPGDRGTCAMTTASSKSPPVVLVRTPSGMFVKDKKRRKKEGEGKKKRAVRYYILLNRDFDGGVKSFRCLARNARQRGAKAPWPDLIRKDSFYSNLILDNSGWRTSMKKNVKLVNIDLKVTMSYVWVQKIRTNFFLNKFCFV